MSEPVSYSRWLEGLAAARPEEPALIFSASDRAEEVITWAALVEAALRAAHRLRQVGVAPGTTVVVGLPNCPQHVIATWGAWKLGALVLPLKHNLVEREREELVALAAPAAVIANWPSVSVGELVPADDLDGGSVEPLPDVVAHPGKSIASGGSTGRSKIIIDPSPLVVGPEQLGAWSAIGLRDGQVQLTAGALYHNSPFTTLVHGLLNAHTIVLMDHFDADRVLDLIERHRVQFLFLAPTMMQRIARCHDVATRDLSSVEALFHTAAPCPPWLKRAWVDLVGAEHVYEGFGASENVGMTVIRGDEWLEHPGSVGRPAATELRIADEHGSEVNPGEVGEIYMRPARPRHTYEYKGAEPAKTTEGGFVSVGDLGWVDDGGYLFLADRRVDLIITGGANVYPAEVEAVLSEHPAVDDVAVVGVPDEEWGRRVHAVVRLGGETAPAVEELDTYCRERLSSYKVPKSYEFVTEFPRDEAGKLRRSALVEERP